jgi:hypothetical protein
VFRRVPEDAEKGVKPGLGSIEFYARHRYMSSIEYMLYMKYFVYDKYRIPDQEET